LTDHKDLRPLTRRKFGFCCLFRLHVSDLLGSLSADATPHTQNLPSAHDANSPRKNATKFQLRVFQLPRLCCVLLLPAKFHAYRVNGQHSCDICYRSVIGHCARPGLRLVC
jgi:hypothetical protein